MATSARELAERSLGATMRRDRWWAAPLATALGLGAFGVYATWAAWTGSHYEWGPYLSPLYSPLFKPDWWPFSPAFLILAFPLGFRGTCYYYRKAYYRAYFLDPPACSVGEPNRDYRGETRLFLFQNLHRVFLFFAVLIIGVLAYDAVKAMIWPRAALGAHGEMPPGPRTFGLGVGTLVMTVNVILLGGYTFGCHSLRHLIGGNVDCFSCALFGKARFKAWRGVTRLNERHMNWAWVSLVWVAFTDVYIRLCAMGVIRDLRLF